MKTQKSTIILGIFTAFIICSLLLTACENGTTGHTHEWGNWTVTTAATCIAEGAETRVCAQNASHTETRSIAVDPNAHEWVITDTTATCTSAGDVNYACAREGCGETKQETVTNLDHVFDDWIVVTAATTAAAGEEKRICQRQNCTYEETQPIPILLPTQGLAFELIENGTAYSVSKGTVTTGDVIIPAVYNDLPVTTIENYGFKYTGITSVIIPDSITSIGIESFSDCISLTNIIIPNSVVSIGFSVFSGCENLSITWYYNPLVSFPNKDYLTEVIIPDGTTSIGSYAFNGCSRLTSITIPASVTSIGGYGIFSGCDNLSSVTWYYNPAITADAFQQYLTEVIISDGTTSIGSYAFNDCSRLTSITIPASVTSINDYAFDGCISLTNIIIPNSVVSIGYYAFYDFDNLSIKWYYNPLLTFPQESKKYITEVIIPDGKTSIENSAFSGFTGLTNITIPASVTSINGYAFSGCTGLTNVTIPVSVISIGYGIFNGCDNLSIKWYYNPLVYFPNKEYLTEVIIPDGTTSIENGAFSGCTELTNITIPASVSSIGNYVFDGCDNLSSVTWYYNESVSFSWDDRVYITEVIIPDGTTSISNNAFQNCTGLTSITVPASVTSIGSNAFNGCDNLYITWYYNPSVTTSGFNNSTVIIHADITSIEITYWKEIIIDGNNQNFSANNGILYNKNRTQLIRAPRNISGTIIIPSGVTSISNNAFSGCGNLTSITIPSGVTSIDSYVFADCYSLANITIPKGITSIGNYAFNNCGLTSIVIPEGVTTINHSAFRGCFALETVSIPASITLIDDYAFTYCENLSKVTILSASAPLLGTSQWSSIFASNKEVGGSYQWITHPNLRIEVPASSYSSYTNRVDWGVYISRIFTY